MIYDLLLFTLFLTFTHGAFMLVGVQIGREEAGKQ